uniref:Integrase n=1 Tax=Rhizobium phage IG49 TaxID=3129228 RepID=A0AAU8HYN4_9CAUD
MEFRQSKNDSYIYHVYENGVRLGLVKKKELWVVRGTRIAWEPYLKNKCLGTMDTRKSAAEALLMVAKDGNAISNS